MLERLRRRLRQNGSYDATVCDWFAPPSKPGPGGNGGQTSRSTGGSINVSELPSHVRPRSAAKGGR